MTALLGAPQTCRIKGDEGDTMYRGVSYCILLYRVRFAVGLVGAERRVL